ncbi:MAG: hypothetical protein KAJ93_02350 [Methanosarcinales archaeon]|nr:hypothetical protein [Methanosarcinales archaeon]
MLDTTPQNPITTGIKNRECECINPSTKEKQGDIIDKMVRLSDSANVPEPILLNSSTSTVIAEANPDRKYFHVSSSGTPNEVWIKLQPASVDDDKKGIFLVASVGGDGSWEMPSNSIYTGEISAIAGSNGPTVSVTEF